MSFQKRFLVLISLITLLIVGFIKTKKPTPYHFSELKYFPPMPLPENNPVTMEGVALGRFLFYDPILSYDSSISCASCHKQESAFSDAPTQFSTGINGQKLFRNTMPLFNLAWYKAYFWDGKASSLESQVFHPVRAHNEMALDWPTAVSRIERNIFYRKKMKAAFGEAKIDSILIAKAIAQFERTLISNNSKYDQVLMGKAQFSKDEYEGFELVNNQTKGNCLHCHTTDSDALGTTGNFSNNGLDPVYQPFDYTDKGLGGISGKENELGLFKIPSLRNVALTAPYMHDGRFKTLEEVINFYSDHVHNSYNIDSKMEFNNRSSLKLTEEEKKKIVLFLHTLTDSSFINNPNFSNPFK